MPPYFQQGPDHITSAFNGLMFVIFVLGGLGIGALVLSAVRSSGRGNQHHLEQILKERYARGEINEDELEEKLTFLRSDAHATPRRWLRL